RNADRWDHAGSCSYRNSSGEILDAATLIRRLLFQSFKLDYIVQPRVTNHPALADLSNGALATVRILTCRNENGGFEATDAAFRMATGINDVVDNFHAGGNAAAVDGATGELGGRDGVGMGPAV